VGGGSNSSGSVIAHIDGFYHQAAITFRDRLRPTE
jgi:hypothetical protein